MTMAGAPDDLFLDLDDLPDVPLQEAEPATDHLPPPTTEEDALPPLDEAERPPVASTTQTTADPFAFAMPSLDDTLRADGLFEDEEEMPAQSEEDEPAAIDAKEVLPAPGLEVREQSDGRSELPEVAFPVEPHAEAVEPEADFEPEAAIIVEDEPSIDQGASEPAVEGEPDESQRAEQATVSIPHPYQGFVSDPADVAAAPAPKRRQLAWIGSGIALTVAVALAVFLALPISKESAPHSEAMASSTPVDPELPRPEPVAQVVEQTPEASGDPVANVIAADEAEPIVAPAPEPTEPTPTPVVEATPPKFPTAATSVAKPAPVAAKPTPKPAPEKRDWQDDALDSLDAFEKHL